MQVVAEAVAPPHQHGGYEGHEAHEQSPVLRDEIAAILREVFNSESTESADAVVEFCGRFRWRAGTGLEDVGAILKYPLEVRSGKLLEALGHFVSLKRLLLDAFVEPAQSPGTPAGLLASLQDCQRRLQQLLFAHVDHTSGHYTTDAAQTMAEFAYSALMALLQKGSECLASALCGQVIGTLAPEDVMNFLSSPAMLLAFFVQQLEEIMGKLGSIVGDLYRGHLSPDMIKSSMLPLCQYFSVSTPPAGVPICSMPVEMHASAADPAYARSSFRIHLVNSLGQLLGLLVKLENARQLGCILAVDFEGMKLCRSGALCLVQIACSDRPELVYVLDIYTLGKNAFTLQTPNGTSMKGILEDESITKVWFDPRNDVDALYHQFGIYSNGIFDLQLAEVADRRNRGLKVAYVQGLNRCIKMATILNEDQKDFSNRIGDAGKALYEPQHGGQYEVFQQRPLDPVLLVYSAHDSRYLLPLYDMYTQALGPHLHERVRQASKVRGDWCLMPVYAAPTTDAPDF